MSVVCWVANLVVMLVVGMAALMAEGIIYIKGIVYR